MVADYRIEGMLGAGGMGEVYAAVHPLIGKRAAIKVLRAELSVNREAVERFVQEARAVNQIGHPNIVDVFAFGALADGRSYFVMEWLKGESLRARIKRDRMLLSEVEHVVEGICVALEAAHEKGIVHRDLKPDNVFLVAVKNAPPMVKLLDFGIAKLMGTEDTRVERTRTGNLLGTPAYIAPEQARGEQIDQRVDVYSLGAMAYEMLAREVPFPARSAMDMVAQHLYTEAPSVRRKARDVPTELDALIARMMAKAPELRPSLDDVRAGFARAVESAKGRPVRGPSSLGEEETPPAQVGTMETVHAYTTPVAVEPPRPMRWIVPVLAVVALGGGVAAFVLTRGDDDAPPAAVPTPSVPAPAFVAPPADAAVEVVAPPDAAVAAPPVVEPERKKAKKDRRRTPKPDPRVTTPKPPPPPPPPPDDDAPMEPK
jgi:serine/threonine-protein kinase